jgi:hypothetical protein
MRLAQQFLPDLVRDLTQVAAVFWHMVSCGLLRTINEFWRAQTANLKISS